MTCGDMTKGHPGPLSQVGIDSGQEATLKAEMNVGTALHFSEDKSGVDQIPIEVLLEWGQVYTFGAKKYGRDNWRLGTDWHEFYGSTLRHLFAFWGGEDIDSESSLSHLAHALWNIAAIRHYQLHDLGKDDRPNV